MLNVSNHPSSITVGSAFILFYTDVYTSSGQQVLILTSKKGIFVRYKNSEGVWGAWNAQVAFSETW